MLWALHIVIKRQFFDILYALIGKADEEGLHCQLPTFAKTENMGTAADLRNV